MDINIPSLIREIGLDDADGRIRAKAETVLRLSKAKGLKLGKKNEGLRSYVATDLALGRMICSPNPRTSAQRSSASFDAKVSDDLRKVMEGCPALVRVLKQSLTGEWKEKRPFTLYPSGEMLDMQLGIAFSRNKLVKAAHSKEKVYNEAYQHFRNVLGSRVQGGKIEHLAVKFAGGTTERARALLNLYQEACRSTVTVEKSNRLDYDMPKYHAAAFRVATIEAKMKVKRKDLADEVNMDHHELDRICVDIVRKCGLGDSEHITKALRLSAPRSEDKGQDTDGKSKKRTSSGQERTGGTVDASPDTATTTRLGVPESSLSTSPENSGGPTETLEKRLDFSRAIASGDPRSEAADPTVYLKSFLKRLRTLESSRYEEWVQRALL